MKIVFVSNYLTIHQLNLCRSFYSQKNVTFNFVSSFKPQGDKLKFSNFEDEPYVIKAYLSDELRNAAIKTIKNADIIIFGSGDKSLISNRNQIIFFYLEHFSRGKINFLRKLHIKYLYQKYKNSYLLCASSHSQNDYNSLGLFKNKCFTFGYFPMLPNIDKTPKFNDKKVKVLWAGREMALKHPEYAFYAAEILYSLNIPYQVSIVSTQNDVLKTLISQNQNKPYFKNINIIDPVSNSEMHNILFASDIFIFSSDKNEGWGAIVNEAMSNGCCVIASNKAGCTNFLIKNQINGLIFDSKDEFKEQILYALKENNFIELGKNAQKTIKDVWNSNKAVINLMQIFDAILNKEKISENLTNKGPGTLII